MHIFYNDQEPSILLLRVHSVRKLSMIALRKFSFDKCLSKTICCEEMFYDMPPMSEGELLAAAEQKTAGYLFFTELEQDLPIYGDGNFILQVGTECLLSLFTEKRLPSREELVKLGKKMRPIRGGWGIAHAAGFSFHVEGFSSTIKPDKQSKASPQPKPEPKEEQDDNPYFIKRISYNEKEKVVVVFFRDGTKEVKHCDKNDPFDVEIGVALALAKRVYGSTKDFKRIVERKAKPQK